MKINLFSDDKPYHFVPLSNVRMMTFLGEDTLVWYNPVMAVDAKGEEYNVGSLECELVQGFNQPEIHFFNQAEIAE